MSVKPIHQTTNKISMPISGAHMVRFSQNVRAIYLRNTLRQLEFFCSYIDTEISKGNNIAAVIPNDSIIEFSALLKENNLLSRIADEKLAILGYQPLAKNSYYFQKDFKEMLLQIESEYKNKQKSVVFYDSDTFLHCELKQAEARQVRDFLIVSNEFGFDIDLISRQPSYKSLETTYIDNTK